jgi:hypothetical protein
MKAEGIDPRTGGWEITQPQYRVYFWEDGGPAGGLGSDEYLITGATDVHEVIEWANSRSGPGKATMYPGAERTYTLYVVSARAERPADEAGLIHIAGVDPTVQR